VATDRINELDVVALTTNVPAEKLVRGQVGTVVMVYEPGASEVEFVDSTGHTCALQTLKGDQLMVLHWEPVAA
jgi:hypothetical protein